METENLIRSIEYLMVETGYIKPGGKKIIVKKLKLNFPQLSMALSGARKDKRSVEILNKVKLFLKRERGKQLLET